ncbi:TIR domain-containing protein [Stigmatella aurantiaca]|uniref:TIR domain-containing protein n=1 Tax=Stigmatella aurantiaca TaxID=41 RepID=A0A1H7HFJ9_STIAU|nr:toll/interleukin-1 receptor domain-containing protein [Stigmatella aurantiaca]SEK49089.1 TIR domain-containing protein [Stigmatella aurantiaca]
MPKRIFLTYAWVDNADGDFDFVVQQLKQAGVGVVYDRVALTPGKRLWEQIGEQLSSDSIDGWAFLVTPNSLKSKACLEEYFLALGRALDTRGEEFPLLALVHGAEFRDLPPSLRIRLGASLSDPDWVEKVIATLENRAPRETTRNLAPYSLRWHVSGAKNMLEVRPRFGTLVSWRVGVPSTFRPSIVGFMEGANGHPPVGGMLVLPVEGLSSDNKLWFVGARGPVGNGVSAFISMRLPFPPHIIVGSEGNPAIIIPVPPL